MKKLIIMMCLVCLLGNMMGMQIETFSGDKFEGRVIGKSNKTYYIETAEAG